MTDTELMERLLSPVAVAVGGAVGATLRWAVLEVMGPGQATWGTFLVNIVGSLFIGLLTARRHQFSQRQILLLGTGFAGGLTTFSSFAVDVARQLDGGNPTSAALNGAGTAIAALLAAGIGFRLGRSRR